MYYTDVLIIFYPLIIHRDTLVQCGTVAEQVGMSSNLEVILCQ